MARHTFVCQVWATCVARHTFVCQDKATSPPHCRPPLVLWGSFIYRHEEPKLKGFRTHPGHRAAI